MYQNRNICRSFNQTITTSLTPLSGQQCSEVILINRTGVDVNVYDNSYIEAENAMLLKDGESITLRGITNTEQVSAITTSSSGLLYYRTQYYSNLASV